MKWILSILIICMLLPIVQAQDYYDTSCLDNETLLTRTYGNITIYRNDGSNVSYVDDSYDYKYCDNGCITSNTTGISRCRPSQADQSLNFYLGVIIFIIVILVIIKKYR